ncbi:MAG: FAD-dependent thymidylate synthase [Oscillospiraceae bacterium]|nr:FAD-dependent thymidylate synthase [Oscillospiraceae bacterium]
MTLIGPSFEFIDRPDGETVLREIERIGRVCYKSEDKTTATSARKFVAGLLRRGHESVVEHSRVTMRVVCDRGVSHEIVRHRIASYTQESTRYCNYSRDKFGGGVTFIKPFFWESDPDKYNVWLESMRAAETAYLRLIEMGAKPEEARGVLPNSLKTELVMTMNLREWRHFFKLRAAPESHPQMREIAVPMLEAMRAAIPVVFDDVCAQALVNAPPS